MEIVSKKNKKITIGKKNNFIKLSYFLISFFFILFFFILGGWAERYNFSQKFELFYQDLINTTANRIHTNFSQAEKLVIDINYKNYQKILNTRNKSLESVRATDDMHKWVPANLSLNGKKYNIKIKLKGIHDDHWRHPYKWSFKIKTNNEKEKKTIFGLNLFSIQNPESRGYIYEWLFMKALKKENLISHRVKFVNVIVNGNNLGIYNLEEQHSKELIENNNRREGPIIGFDKNLWIQEINNFNDLSVNPIEESFLRARISPVQFKDNQINTEQEIYLNKAIYLLDSFRNEKLKTNEVFDTTQLSKLMALKAVFGSVEFDWRDIKFYYNPITSLLEPIGREVHVNHEQSPLLHPWWINDDRRNFLHSVDQQAFLKLIYDDKEFYEEYLMFLDKFSKKNYFNSVVSENIDEFNSYSRLLKKNYPLAEVYKREYIENYRTIIRQTLDPKQGISVNFLNYSENILSLNISNLQRLPVEILNLEFDNGTKINFNERILINGKSSKFKIPNETIEVKCFSQIKCEKMSIKNQYIIYKILGQNKIRKEKIVFFGNTNNLEKVSIEENLNNLKKYPFIKIDENNKNIMLQEGKWVLENKIIFPKEYKIYFKPGTEITLKNKAQIVSFSPIFMKGNKAKPIIIKSDFKGDINKFRNNDLSLKKENSYFGYGILIKNTSSVSEIDNTIFYRLSGPEESSGEGILGAVNFYEADVKINNTKFIENLKGDDFLNIIRSNFSIKNSYFVNTNSDSIDVDFSQGIISNTTFDKSMNDALDFSGSYVSLNNIDISQAGDKAISAGEKSVIEIKKLVIKNSKIGVASKDFSKVNLKDVNIINTNVGITAYKKKKEYGPAEINITNIVFNNVSNEYFLEKYSKITTNGKEEVSTQRNFENIK